LLTLSLVIGNFLSDGRKKGKKGSEKKEEKGEVLEKEAETPPREEEETI